MNKKEFDNLYVGENKVVRCDTLKKAKGFLKLADEFGYKWRFDRKYTHNSNWNDYKEETCYNLAMSAFDTVSYFKKNGYKIIEYPAHTEIETPKFPTKEDLKEGNWVCILRRGDIINYNTHDFYYWNDDLTNKECPDFDIVTLINLDTETFYHRPRKSKLDLVLDKFVDRGWEILVNDKNFLNLRIHKDKLGFEIIGEHLRFQYNRIPNNYNMLEYPPTHADIVIELMNVLKEEE